MATCVCLAALAVWAGRGRISERVDAGEPFAFSELRGRAVLIQRAGGGDAQALATLRGGTARVAALYDDALFRFDSIYGDGVGSAKRTPDFRNCKHSLAGVAALIRSPAPGVVQTEAEPLWGSLRRCRTLAGRWAGPPEVATFGNDLESMTDGALLVLSYVATLNGSAMGPRMYRAAVASDPDRRVEAER